MPERCASPTSAFRTACSSRCGRRRFANGPALWGRRFRCRGSTATNTRAATRSWCRAASSFTGAARLAARGALRAGAGLVTLASPRDGARRQRGRKPRRDGARGRWRGRACARCSPTGASTRSCSGPGSASGAATRDLVRAALDGERAVVLDADALTSFADDAATRCSPRSARPAAGGADAAPGRVRAIVQESSQSLKMTSKIEIARAAAQGLRRGRPAQGRRHRHRGAGRPRRHQRERAALARDRRLRRRARRHDRRPAGAGHAGLRGRVRRRLAARRGRQRGRAGTDRRGSAGGACRRSIGGCSRSLPQRNRSPRTTPRTARLRCRSARDVQQPLAGIVGDESDARRLLRQAPEWCRARTASSRRRAHRAGAHDGRGCAADVRLRRPVREREHARCGRA